MNNELEYQTPLQLIEAQKFSHNRDLHDDHESFFSFNNKKRNGSFKKITPSCQIQTQQKQKIAQKQMDVSVNLKFMELADTDKKESKSCLNPSGNCIDLQHIFKKLSKACRNRLKPIKQLEQTETINQNWQIPSKSFDLLLSSQIQSSLKQQKNHIPSQTYESDMQKQPDFLSYPIMIVYSQISYLTIEDKINYHMDELNHLNVLCENIILQYNSQNPWSELIFLLYKKFYIERVKVERFFKKFPIVTPFKLKKAPITTQQMLNYVKLGLHEEFLEQISHQNKLITHNIETYLNQLPVNLKQSTMKPYLTPKSLSDNFEVPLLKSLWEYIVVSETSPIKSQEQHKKSDQKIARGLQIGFIIGQLMEREHIVGIQVSQGYISAGMAKSFIKEYKKQFKEMVHDKKL